MNRKIVVYDQKAELEIESLERKVQIKLFAYILSLEEKGRLDEPEGKKLKGYELFEMRIRTNGSWRALYSYFKGNRIIILRVFQKKSNKTPNKEIKLALKRLYSHR